MLKLSVINTPLGYMFASASKDGLTGLNFVNSPLGQLASSSEMQGAYGTAEIESILNIREDSSTRGTEQCAAKVEFPKRSNDVEPLKIVVQSSEILDLIEQELSDYFSGTLKKFLTPIDIQSNSPFQKEVLQSLLSIPYGSTMSYVEQANLLQRPKAYRAVARSNGDNKIAIVIPCHRVINSNGKLGGYNAGIYRKKWLIAHESKFL